MYWCKISPPLKLIARAFRVFVCVLLNWARGEKRRCLNNGYVDNSLARIYSSNIRRPITINITAKMTPSRYWVVAGKYSIKVNCLTNMNAVKRVIANPKIIRSDPNSDRHFLIYFTTLWVFLLWTFRLWHPAHQERLT